MSASAGARTGSPSQPPLSQLGCDGSQTRKGERHPRNSCHGAPSKETEHHCLPLYSPSGPFRYASDITAPPKMRAFPHLLDTPLTRGRTPFQAQRVPLCRTRTPAHERTPHQALRSCQNGPANVSIPAKKMSARHGGAEGTRTPDPLHAMEVRYQLRHSPVGSAQHTRGPLAIVGECGRW